MPPTGIDRADILSSYDSFMPPNSPYLNLVYQSNSINSQAAGILNPGAYLAGGANSTSSLNTIWNPVLAQLYTNTQNLPKYALSMVGDDGDYYKGTLKTLPTLPGSQTGSFNVIDFVGYTDVAETMPNGNEFYMYDPATPDPEAPNYNLSTGYQVFANDGVYNDASPNVMFEQNSNPDTSPTKVALGLERDLVCALNRGVGSAVRSMGSVAMTLLTGARKPTGILTPSPTQMRLTWKTSSRCSCTRPLSAARPCSRCRPAAVP